ncbi:hypothetical protein [Dactylosporangium sp. CA-233914]
MTGQWVEERNLPPERATSSLFSSHRDDLDNTTVVVQREMHG